MNEALKQELLTWADELRYDEVFAKLATLGAKGASRFFNFIFRENLHKKLRSFILNFAKIQFFPKLPSHFFKKPIP